MLTLEQIRAALADRNIQVVAQETGVHANIIYRIHSGAVTNPSYKTLQALSEYLERPVGEAG